MGEVWRSAPVKVGGGVSVDVSATFGRNVVDTVLSLSPWRGRGDIVIFLVIPLYSVVNVTSVDTTILWDSAGYGT